MNEPGFRRVPVALAARAYDVLIGGGLLDAPAGPLGELRDGPGTAVVVTDANVRRHADRLLAVLRAQGWTAEPHVLPPGEKTKTLDSVAAIADTLVALPADRGTVVFAVGGGVVGDTAGFAAAAYARGIPLVQVPTSLLAMVDSSVGGKTGVNHPRGKNLLGAFHQPRAVWVDPAVLDTLPEREYRGGLAEVVKYGVIMDADFFAWLEANAGVINERDPGPLTHLVAVSVAAKAAVVAEDEFETTGRRAILNYGHTFAHAYEALAGYGTLSHGEAVSVGMVHVSRLAERLGRIDAAVTGRQVELLAALGLPTTLPSARGFAADDVLARMRLDKKNRDGRLRFVLPTRIGHVELVDDVPEADVRAVLG